MTMTMARPALAISGMNATKDTREGYEFLYPVGWQEIRWTASRRCTRISSNRWRAWR